MTTPAPIPILASRRHVPPLALALLLQSACGGNPQDSGGAPPNLDLDFASDWSAGDPRDGGQWNGYTGAPQTSLPSGTWLTVVPADGLGFPDGMANVLRAEYWQSGSPENPGNDDEMIHARDRWPAPTEGECLFQRVYRRVDIPDGVSIGVSHPWQAEGQTFTTYERTSVSPGAGDGFWRFEVGDVPSNRWYVPNLRKGAVYRVELRLCVVDDRLVPAVLVTGPDDRTVVSDDPVSNDDGRALSTAQQAWPMGPVTVIHLGLNGSNPQGDGVVYWGGFAARVVADSAAWIGPYQANEAMR